MCPPMWGWRLALRCLPQSPLPPYFFFFLETGSLVEHGTHRFGWTNWPEYPEILWFPPSPKRWHCKCVPLTRLCRWVRRSSHSLTFSQQAPDVWQPFSSRLASDFNSRQALTKLFRLSWNPRCSWGCPWTCGPPASIFWAARAGVRVHAHACIRTHMY